MMNCAGLFRIPVDPLSFGERVTESNVIYVGGTLSARIDSTTDGGQTWKLAHLPTGDVPQSVSCALGRCVVMAATPAWTVTGGVTRGGGVHQRRSGRDLAGRQTPAGLRSCLERTHTGRLCDVLDVLGHGNRCGAARRVFAPQLLDQRRCVVRRWRVDMGGSSAAVRRGKSAPRFDQLPSTRRLLVGRLEQRPDHRPTLTLSVILSTPDGGDTWSQEDLPAAPGTLVGAISCPETNVCIGLGGVNAQSGRMSVYGNATRSPSSEEASGPEGPDVRTEPCSQPGIRVCRTPVRRDSRPTSRAWRGGRSESAHGRTRGCRARRSSS